VTRHPALIVRPQSDRQSYRARALLDVNQTSRCEERGLTVEQIGS